MIAFFGSIILGVALASLMFWVSKRFFEELTELTVKRAVISGAVLAVANYTIIKAPALLAVLFIPVAIMGLVYTYLWWKEEGSSIVEMLAFMVINLVIAVVLNNASTRVMDLTSIRWINGVARSLFAISLIMSLGFMIADMIWFRMELTEMKKGGRNDEAEHGTGTNGTELAGA